MAINIGVAAHITAASPGGPRYDPREPTSVRTSAENGIWLCQNCAKLVDNDEASYPVALLRTWKSQAESNALLALQSPPNVPHDVAEALAELREILLELAPSHMPQQRKRSDSRGTPQELYLRQISIIGNRLRADASIAKEPSTTTIFLDLKDLHDYILMAPTSGLLPECCVVDYCIESSPLQLSLPPGSTYELQHILHSASRPDVEAKTLSRAERTVLANLRGAFIDSFEADPDSLTTQHAYQKLLSTWSAIHFNTNTAASWIFSRVGLARLQKLFATGRLTTWHWPADASKQPITAFFEHFQETRPNRTHYNMARAFDMAALNLLLTTHGSARLVTSVQCVHSVADSIYAESPLRTPYEYAAFTRSMELWGHDPMYDDGTFALQVCTDDLRILLPELGSFIGGGTLRADALPILERFADFYRKLLRPVDRMLEASSLVARPSQHASMQELYVALTQGDLAEAFHTWWKQLCAIVAELRPFVPVADAPDEIERFLEEGPSGPARPA
jgi:hypothetical protein